MIREPEAPGLRQAAELHTPRAESPSVLLFAGQPFASRIAACLQQSVTPDVRVAETQSGCLSALHHDTFDLLLLEESVSLFDPQTAAALYDAAGTAVVVELNFGLMQPERVVLATRAALNRRRRDLLTATEAARAALKDDLTVAISGLLLESQLTLRQAGPSPAPALQRLVDLAEHVCAQLRTDEVLFPLPRTAIPASEPSERMFRDV